MDIYVPFDIVMMTRRYVIMLDRYLHQDSPVFYSIIMLSSVTASHLLDINGLTFLID